MRSIYICLFLSSCFFIIDPISTKGQVYPSDFGQVVVATGMKVATAVAFAPDGRIFVTEQTGNIRIIKNNALLPTPFASVSTVTDGERGLLGIAIDPDFAVNKYVYVYYTVGGSPARNRISRFTAATDVAPAGSEIVILNLDPLSTATIHNGGAIHFGKDGKLYVAVGENANQPSAQDLDTYHGKLLRINKDGSVPAGNPFPTGSEQRRRIWAYGLRNPFTFSVDQETGKIFVNDVGHGLWEEINDATVGGRNFGWPTTEGKFNQATYPDLSNPVYAYAHGSGDGIGCAIVGGAFVSPSNTNYPANYRGKYFFQEFCNLWINTIDISGPTAVRSPFATSVISNSLGMTIGPDGYLYYLARHWEGLIRIVYNKTTTPSISNHPVNASVGTGQPANFSVNAMGTAPLTYQWQKNGVNIPGATSASFEIASVVEGDAGQYRVIVTNAAGNVTSNPATLSVISNASPVAEILTPIAGATYVAGTTINFSGSGNDAEDGPLGAQSFSWAINFHHNTHHHDQPAVNGITAGTFQIPNIGETSDNVWYNIILTVTDANGLKGQDSVRIEPLKSNINLATVPPGLQITLDGQPFNTPGSVVSVEGLVRTLGVITPQTINNETYAFSSWTHGGAESQTITTPTNDVTYTANFTRVENENTFYRAFNLNGPAVAIDGNNWEASSSAPNFSATGLTFTSPGVTLLPSTDVNRATMIRSSFWGNANVTVSSVPAGNYEVSVYVWEDNAPFTFSVSLEGTTVQANYNSGSAGTWKKLGPFPVTINDGTINLAAVGFQGNLSGIEIWRSGSANPNRPPIVANPLTDQSATAGTAFSYLFPVNSFSDPDPATQLTYAATLSNGSLLPGWLSFNAANRSFTGTPGATDAGTIEVRVTASDGAGDSISDTFFLQVNAGAGSTFYRAFNLNGPAVAIDGNNWEASTSAPNFSATGLTFTSPGVTLVPSTDVNRATMIRSSFWGNANVTVSSVPAGNYEVSVYAWEDNFPFTFSISLEGTTVQANYNSGSAGTWKKLGPFPVTINDGTINLAAVGFQGNLSGIEIWRSGSANPNRPPIVANPLTDQSATAGTAFSYLFPVNSFSDPDPATQLTYAATLSNGNLLPGWLSFNAANRSFTGTPGATDAGTIEVRVTASDGAGDSISDTFFLQVNAGGGSTFYRAFNLNGPAVAIDGNNWEASSSAPNFSATGLTFTSPGVTLVPSTDVNRATMIRSSFWGNANVTVSSVPAGNYEVSVYAWEDNAPFTFSVSLEGTTVQANYNSGTAGTWKKLGPFPVTINDGTINLAAVGFQGNLSGVEIWSTSADQLRSSSTARMAPVDSSELKDEESDNLSLSAYPNPFSQKVTVSFGASEAAHTRISMYDIRGRKVRSVFEGNVESGYKAEVELEPEGLIDGIYILEMINGVKTKRLKIMMVR